jgi:quaternary ammonium compound-resistance protein SugE
MAWLQLVVAGLLEVGWAVGLKQTYGFTRFWPSVVTLVLMVGSFWLLALAQRTLPMGTAYAVWTGIGVLGTTIVGILLLGEPRDALRLGCIALIMLGIVGLKVLTPEPGSAATASQAAERPTAPS